MRRVLLVKTSSLGDVVHNFPVVSDILAAEPHARISWVVEEAYVDLVRLHPGVATIIATAVRRWRRSLFDSASRAELGSFLSNLRSTTYDDIIDTQGLLKSALITRAAIGRRHGLDWKSSREPLRPFYDRCYSVPWGQHAVVRNRSLGAFALGYGLSPTVDYGLRCPAGRPSWAPSSDYAVLLHATSASDKLWPEDRWTGLGRQLRDRGLTCVLAWGSRAECARSERLAAAIPDAVVAPRMSLGEAAALLSYAACVFGVDTGLAHLAGALGMPTVGIYCATDPAATGLYGCARSVNCGGIGRCPSVNEVFDAWSAMS